ncbi:hypothetical protein HD557_002672 [Nocardioides luteus]|nr:hypothetical protein [Nocardioides luteus]
MTATNDQVAEIYQREFPGLVDLGRGFPRGRRLCREPQAPTASPVQVTHDTPEAR